MRGRALWCALFLGCAPVDEVVVTSPLVGATPVEASGTATVAEVLPAGSYTYLRFAESEAGVWHVISSDAPAVGDQVTYRAFAELTDFHSTRLNRDFPRLVFSTSRGEAP